MALDEEQIAFFKEEGYLILKGFIDPQQVAEWRGQFWRHVGADPHDPASWPDSYVIEGFGVDPAFGQLPFLPKRRHRRPRMRDYSGCWAGNRTTGPRPPIAPQLR